MQKFIAKTLFCLVIIQTQAQTNKLSNNDIVKDKIVYLLNQGDYRGVYNLAASNFKKNISEDQIINLLQGTADFGDILKTEILSTNKGGVSKYRLVYEKKSLHLEMKATKKLTFEVFGLSFYTLPIVPTRKVFLNDNMMKTKLDSSVQRAITAYMSNENVSGLSVGIIQNGNMFTYNFGETKKGSKQLPTCETIYEIGSITKTFTGIILANNVLEGRLNLSDDIRMYLDGDFPNLEYNGKPIQLVHLSNHTSRLLSQPKIVGTRKDPIDPSQLFSEKILSDILHNIKIDTIPGHKIEYSNFAVSLLGYILEKVNNLTYEELLNKYIFVPTKMTHSKISFSTNDFLKYAQGYTLGGDTTGYWRNKLAEPAGGIRATSKDMLLYISAQLEAKKGSPYWLSHQLTAGTNLRGKGLNWGISTTKKGYLLLSHDGGTSGFSSLCLIYPELKSGIILLTNNGNHNDESFYDIGKLIYSDWVK